MNKELIQNRFSKNLKSYNENAKIQKRMAENLISYIEIQSPKKILEIGCGTGFLTELISNKFQIKQYQAIDIVEDCESFIKKINPEIEFYAIDIEEYLKTKSDEKFDLIISNAALQWVDNFESTINSLKSRLNNNGEFVFTTFGNENFREIFHIVGTSLKYYSIEELKQMFPNAVINQEIHIMAFKTAIDVLKHLQLTGVNGIKNQAWTKKDLIKFENSYKNICTLRPTLTYNPIYIKIN